MLDGDSVLGRRRLPAHQVTPEGHPGIQWEEIRCCACGRLLQKIERQALRPGKHIEIKCSRCKAINRMVGPEPH